MHKTKENFQLKQTFEEGDICWQQYLRKSKFRVVYFWCQIRMQCERVLHRWTGSVFGNICFRNSLPCRMTLRRSRSCVCQLSKEERVSVVKGNSLLGSVEILPGPRTKVHSIRTRSLNQLQLINVFKEMRSIISFHLETLSQPRTPTLPEIDVLYLQILQLWSC